MELLCFLAHVVLLAHRCFVPMAAIKPVYGCRFACEQTPGKEVRDGGVCCVFGFFFFRCVLHFFIGVL